MSNFGTLNWADLGKGFLIAFLAAFLGSLYTVLSAGAFPSSSELMQWAAAGLAAGVAYLLKNLFTSSDNKLFGKEEPK